jgi:predicted RNA-binding protein with PUA-like domain
MGVKRVVAKKVAVPKVLKSALPARAKGEVRYWLLKQEPSAFSFDDLLAAPKRTTCWDGVRNYTARNFLRDEMAVGDQAFYYHSNADPSSIAGIVEVVRAGYPDHTAFDSTDEHFDPDSDPAAPTWYMVDVRAVKRIDPPITLDQLRGMPELEGMELLRRGSRLSVTPVSAAHWARILRRVKG